MLVGISGKIGSGKDTLAAFLKQTIDHLNLTNHGPRSVQIKKYADALKEVVCLLTGCRRMELEDQAFKSSNTDPVWNRTARDAREWLIMKDFVQGTGTPYGHLDDAEVERMARQRGFKFERTYREMLQEIGTEVFRNHFHPQTWINATFAHWQMIPGSERHWRGHAISMSENPEVWPRWIITDVRFPDEAKAIKDRGGLVLRIHRLNPQMIPHDVAVHPSETSLDNYNDFDAIIDNNGTLDSLRKKAIDIVNKFNLK